MSEGLPFLFLNWTYEHYALDSTDTAEIEFHRKFFQKKEAPLLVEASYNCL